MAVDARLVKSFARRAESGKHPACRDPMFGRRKHREDRRYYLLPGMGRSNKRHRRKVHRAAVLFGIVVSLLFGALLYWMQNR